MSSGLCSTENTIKFSNKSRRSVYGASDTKIIEMLQDGPVAIAVAASDWEGYSQGVLGCSYFSQVDHAALLVGYTSSYWIIKNSWGSHWGEKVAKIN